MLSEVLRDGDGVWVFGSEFGDEVPDLCGVWSKAGHDADTGGITDCDLDVGAVELNA